MKDYFRRRMVLERACPDVVWKDTFTGSCECPGAEFHQLPRVFAEVDLQTLTISCTGNGCNEAREIALKKPRRVLKEGKPGTARARRLRRALFEGSDPYLKFAQEGAKQFKSLADQGFVESAWPSMSPTPIPTEVSSHWKLILMLLHPLQVVWIGERYQSGKRYHKKHFGPVELWRTLDHCPGPYICPTGFKRGAFNRLAGSVYPSSYALIRSTRLLNDQFSAAIKWISQQLDLLAIVSDGTKLHAWTLPPVPQTFWPDKFKWAAFLLGMGCDASFYRDAEVTPLPGWEKDSRKHRLLYLDLELADTRAAKDKLLIAQETERALKEQHQNEFRLSQESKST